MPPGSTSRILWCVSVAVFDELRRPLTFAGAAAWLMVGLPVLMHGGIPAWRLEVWAATWVSFATLLFGALASTSLRTRLLLLALCVVAVVAMVLLLCDGFEGALLVLIALRLGGSVSRRVGIGWTVIQTALLGAGIAVHWTPSAALLLAPPYLGFSLLAFALADLLAGTAAQRRALAAANAELRAAQRLAVENSRLAERMHIARDLHDTVGHRLTALGINLEIAGKLAGGAVSEPIAMARELVKAALGDVRAAVERLHDDERIDLATTLRTLASDMPALRVHLAVPDGLCNDDPERAVALLRCTQEIITNAARHARAENLWIDITESDLGAVELMAHDDGRGAREAAPGNGLRGMRERVAATGGSVETSSPVGKGFRVRAILPARRA
jgi:signal transduction histidine kinase